MVILVAFMEVKDDGVDIELQEVVVEDGQYDREPADGEDAVRASTPPRRWS